MSKIYQKIFYLITLFSLVIPLLGTLGLVQKVLAADTPAPTIKIGLGASGAFTKLNDVTAGKLLPGALTLVLIVVTITFFFILVMGGVSWITSGGDEKKVAAARNKITNALVGLAIIFATWAIISLLKTIFGVDLLNLNITGIKTE